MLGDYQRALKDLDKVDFLEPKNTFTLQSHVDAKNMLKDYELTLQDLDKANFLEPNNTFILQSCGDVKKTLKAIKEL
jgi:tetratricopeptide (TPR) repeat protein